MNTNKLVVKDKSPLTITETESFASTSDSRKRAVSSALPIPTIPPRSRSTGANNKGITSSQLAEAVDRINNVTEEELAFCKKTALYNTLVEETLAVPPEVRAFNYIIEEFPQVIDLVKSNRSLFVSWIRLLAATESGDTSLCDRKKRAE